MEWNGKLFHKKKQKQPTVKKSCKLFVAYLIINGWGCRIKAFPSSLGYNTYLQFYSSAPICFLVFFIKRKMLLRNILQVNINISKWARTAIQITFAANIINVTNMSAQACPPAWQCSAFSNTVMYFPYCQILLVICASSLAFPKPSSPLSSLSVHSHRPLVPKMSSVPIW